MKFNVKEFILGHLENFYWSIHQEMLTQCNIICVFKLGSKLKMDKNECLFFIGQ